jgi:hypothetical protein
VVSSPEEIFSSSPPVVSTNEENLLFSMLTDDAKATKALLPFSQTISSLVLLKFPNFS